MDKPVFVDRVTRVCADWLNAVSDTVWDVLGAAKTPAEGREAMGVQEVAPETGGPYVGFQGGWATATDAALAHNTLTGRSVANGHPMGAITGLEDLLAKVSIYEHDAAKAYSVGDFATTLSHIWRANTTIAAGTAFDVNQWDMLPEVLVSPNPPPGPIYEGTIWISDTTEDLYWYVNGHWVSAQDRPTRTQFTIDYRVVEVTNTGTATYNVAYTVGYVWVWVNGVCLAPADFTATNGTSITLKQKPQEIGDAITLWGLTILATDEVEIVANNWTAGTVGRTDFDIGRVISKHWVFLNGVLLRQSDYSLVDYQIIRLAAGANEKNDQVRLIATYERDASDMRIMGQEWVDSPGANTFTFQHDPDYLMVFLNGVMLRKDTDFTSDVDGSSFTTHFRLRATAALLAVCIYEVVEGDAPDCCATVEQIEGDLDGVHTEGTPYAYALFRRIEKLEAMEYYRTEQLASFIRNFGGSGILSMRAYNLHGHRAYNRVIDTGYGALNIHTHADVDAHTMGMAELMACVNGYQVNTRHNDYRLAVGAPTASEPHQTVDIAIPAVPPSVLSAGNADAQIAEMRQYLYALAEWQEGLSGAGEGINRRDFTPYFKGAVSYLEVWFQDWEVDDNLEDVSPSIRHKYPYDTLGEMHDVVMGYANQGGLNRIENAGYLGTPVRALLPDGTFKECAMYYRIVCVDLGTLADLIAANQSPAKALVPIDSPAVRHAMGFSTDSLPDSRAQRFTVKYTETEGLTATESKGKPGILDKWMAEAAGFEGPDDDVLLDTMTQKTEAGNIISDPIYNYATTNRLKAARYNRIFSAPNGASGRGNFLRGHMNDQKVWIAKTTNPIVSALPDPGTGELRRYSYAIPLEFLVISPLANWNPYNLPLRDETTITGDGTEENPVNGYTLYSLPLGAFHMKTPAETFDNLESADPADTQKGVKWAWQGGVPDSTKREMLGSGQWVMLPEVDIGGAPKRVRQRFPIYSVWAEQSLTAGLVAALREDVKAAGVDIPTHFI